jgi:hypothetical protein
MLDPRLDTRDGVAGVTFVPDPIEVLGHHAELNDEVCREVLWADLAPLFLPQPDQGLLILPRDDPGVGTTDEAAAVNICLHADK